MKTVNWVVLVLSAFLVLGCGDSSGPERQPDPIPGWLRIRLNSPNANDGAIMFTVSGGTIQSVRSSYPDLFFPSSVGTSKRIIVAGNLVPGILVDIQVPDVQLSENYNVVVEQIAARDTYEQRQSAGYSLTVER